MGTVVDFGVQRRLRGIQKELGRVESEVGRFRDDLAAMRDMLAPARDSLAGLEEQCRAQLAELEETLDFCAACEAANDPTDIRALERARDELLARHQARKAQGAPPAAEAAAGDGRAAKCAASRRP